MFFSEFLDSKQKNGDIYFLSAHSTMWLTNVSLAGLTISPRDLAILCQKVSEWICKSGQNIEKLAAMWNIYS
jgi:hypothetical protein